MSVIVQDMTETPSPSSGSWVRKGTEGKQGVRGRERSPPGIPERSGGSDRLDALRLRVILRRIGASGSVLI